MARDGIEFLTGSPDVWDREIERAHRNPSPERLWARFEARLILAYRKTKDLETLNRVWWEACNEMQAAQAEAYTMRRRANQDRGKTLGKDTVKQKQESRDRRRSVIA